MRVGPADTCNAPREHSPVAACRCLPLNNLACLFRPLTSPRRNPTCHLGHQRRSCIMTRLHTTLTDQRTLPTVSPCRPTNIVLDQTSSIARSPLSPGISPVHNCPFATPLSRPLQHGSLDIIAPRPRRRPTCHWLSVYPRNFTRHGRRLVSISLASRSL